MLKATHRHTQIDNKPAGIRQIVVQWFGILQDPYSFRLWELLRAYPPTKGKKLITVKDTYALHGEVQLFKVFDESTTDSQV